MIESTEVYHKLTEAVRDVMKEYGVKWIDVNRDYWNWKDEYLEDPLSRWSKIIAEHSNKKE